MLQDPRRHLRSLPPRLQLSYIKRPIQPTRNAPSSNNPLPLPIYPTVNIPARRPFAGDTTDDLNRLILPSQNVESHVMRRGLQPCQDACGAEKKGAGAD